MIIRILAVLAVLGVIGAATFTYFRYSGQTVVVRISEEHILERMNKKMPVTRTIASIVDVTLTNPGVEIIENSERIRASLDFSAKLKFGDNKPAVGRVVASGVLHYDPENAWFFLKEAEIEDMQIKGVSPLLIDQVRKRTRKLVKRTLENRPVHKLKDKNLRQVTTKMILKHVEVKDNYMLATLGL